MSARSATWYWQVELMTRDGRAYEYAGTTTAASSSTAANRATKRSEAQVRRDRIKAMHAPSAVVWTRCVVHTEGYPEQRYGDGS